MRPNKVVARVETVLTSANPDVSSVNVWAAAKDRDRSTANVTKVAAKKQQDNSAHVSCIKTHAKSISLLEIQKKSEIRVCGFLIWS